MNASINNTPISLPALFPCHFSGGNKAAILNRLHKLECIPCIAILFYFNITFLYPGLLCFCVLTYYHFYNRFKIVVIHHLLIMFGGIFEPNSHLFSFVKRITNNSLETINKASMSTFTEKNIDKSNISYCQ